MNERCTIALMRQRACYLPVLILVACLAGCAPDLYVTTIQLGRSLNTDNTVATQTTRFAPTDTVYVSIGTAGSGSAVLSVRWTYAGQVVGEPKKDISYRGAAVTEFHLQNAGGFPLGDYSVEIFLNGQSAGVRPFKVEEK